MPAAPFADVDAIRARVGAYAPRAQPDGHRSLWAATALIVAPGTGGPELVFIERPRRRGDRWSGQMALPGGKRDRHDADVLRTAVREAREEVGVVLPQPAGRLDDVRGRTYRGIVATYVFALDVRPQLHPHPAEVAAAVWIPLHALLSQDAACRYTWAGVGRFPALCHDGHVIWGLTHRILASFARALGVALPHPP